MATRDPGCLLPTPQFTPLTSGSTPAFLESSAPHLRERLLTFPSTLRYLQLNGFQVLYPPHF